MKKVLKSSNERRASLMNSTLKSLKACYEHRAWVHSRLWLAFLRIHILAERTVCFDVDYVFIKRLHGERKHRQHCPQTH